MKINKNNLFQRNTGKCRDITEGSIIRLTIDYLPSSDVELYECGAGVFYRDTNIQEVIEWL